jgi:sialic acid synthase SpsE
MVLFIGDTPVGPSRPVYFIAEIGSNFDQDLTRAYSLIHMARDAGANAAKFQHYTSESLINQSGFERLSLKSHQNSWDGTVSDVYDRAKLNAEWTYRLREECINSGIEFLTSPYSEALVDFVAPFISAFKIGSGEITNIPLLKRVVSHNKPVLLATGASTLNDIDRALSIIPENIEICLMQCNTNYESSVTSYKHQHIKVLNLFKERYPSCLLGLSCHLKTPLSVFSAVVLGACVIEKHFTDDCSRPGPDHKFALNSDEFASMISSVRDLQLILGDPFKRVEENEQSTYYLQRRSLALKRDLPSGHILEEDDLHSLRPLLKNSFHPYEIHLLLGKRLKSSLSLNTILTSENIS